MSLWSIAVAACLVGAVACKKDDPAPAGPALPGADAGDTAPPANGCLKPAGARAFEPGQACACATDCTTANCQDGFCCQGNACARKRPNGATCTASSACTSGFCSDGVCCDVACTGSCKTCNLPTALGECTDVDDGKPDPRGMCVKEAPATCGLNGFCDGAGACAKYQDDTICRAEVCQTPSMYVPPGTCDGNGKCFIEQAEACEPAACENNKCVTTCTVDTQCAPGKACVNGSCGEFPVGRACAKADDCVSGFCIDGVCCATECDEVCMTCAAAGMRGTCAPASTGTVDPACVVADPTTCLTNGKCDGTGKCANYDNTTTCRPARCDEASSSAIPAVRCNNGTCPADPAAATCAPFVGCNGTSCLTSCSSDAQCAAGRVCSAGACVAATAPEDAAPPVD